MGCAQETPRSTWSFTLLRKIERGDAGNESALERVGPAPPGHQAIGRTGEQLRALHQRMRIGAGIEMTEDIGPGRRRWIGPPQHRGAAALAIGKATQRLNGD